MLTAPSPGLLRFLLSAHTTGGGAVSEEKKMTDLEHLIPYISRHLEHLIYESATPDEQLQAFCMAVQDIDAFINCSADPENELYCAAVAEQTIFRLRNRNFAGNPAVVSESIEGAGSVQYSEDIMARTLSPRAQLLCRKLNAGVRITRG